MAREFEDAMKRIFQTPKLEPEKKQAKTANEGKSESRDKDGAASAAAAGWADASCADMLTVHPSPATIPCLLQCALSPRFFGAPLRIRYTANEKLPWRHSYD